MKNIRESPTKEAHKNETYTKESLSIIRTLKKKILYEVSLV